MDPGSALAPPPLFVEFSGDIRASSALDGAVLSPAAAALVDTSDDFAFFTSKAAESCRPPSRNAALLPDTTATIRLRSESFDIDVGVKDHIKFDDDDAENMSTLCPSTVAGFAFGSSRNVVWMPSTKRRSARMTALTVSQLGSSRPTCTILLRIIVLLRFLSSRYKRT